MLDIIERVRTGSHKEFVATDDKGHGYHNIVIDYTTVYHDCLPGVEWLQAHEHDLDGYEPTIEITVDGKTLSVNGNYKQGVITNFMSQYTERVRAGKKTMTISKGDAVVNCGGGVYIAVSPDRTEEFVKGRGENE